MGDTMGAAWTLRDDRGGWGGEGAASRATKTQKDVVPRRAEPGCCERVEVGSRAWKRRTESFNAEASERARVTPRDGKLGEMEAEGKDDGGERPRETDITAPARDEDRVYRNADHMP